MIVPSPIKVIIFGAGASRADMIEILFAVNEAKGEKIYDFVGYLDDDSALWGTTVRGFPVLGGIACARDYPHASFVNGIGSAQSFRRKSRIQERAEVDTDRYVTLVHPQATVSPSATVGRGCVLMPGARLSANSVIGDGVILMHNSFVGHDTQVESHTYFAPGAMSAGFNRVGSSCYLGMQSSLRERIVVGHGSLIGMGAVVLKDVKPNSMAVGNPARVIRQFAD